MPGVGDYDTIYVLRIDGEKLVDFRVSAEHLGAPTAGALVV